MNSARHPAISPFPNCTSQLPAALMRLANRLIAQSPPEGARPTLYAATAPEVHGCDYIRPGGLFGLGGPPQKAHSDASS